MAKTLARLTAILVIFAAVDRAPGTDVYTKDKPHDFTANFFDRAAWERRADSLRRQALVAQGLWPMPERTPLNAVIHGRIDRDAYTIDKVYFQSTPGHYVTGNLYRPKNHPGKLPAVLSPYGHWPDGRFNWRDDAGVNQELASGAEVDAIAARAPLQANCAMLARMGCVVFIYDMVGYCDSKAIPHREGFADAEAILRAQSFMGLQTWNSIRAIDFISALPDVDPERIAVTGSSSGGTQTIALCAVDPRPAVAFPMVMVSMNMQGGCACENAPLYRIGTNNVELACLFAPKPLGHAAANDWTIDFESRGLPQMKHIWSLYGAADHVDGKHIDFGHNHNLHSRELQYAFVNKHLKLGWPEPVREEKFEPVPPGELSVWTDRHPLPEDFVGVVELRKRLSRAGDEQLAALDRDDYAKVVRAALEAMVVDQPLTEAELRTVTIDARSNAPRAVVVIAKSSADGDVAALLDAGFAVARVALSPPDPLPIPAPSQPNTFSYGIYGLGYNRSTMANRVRDIRIAIAAARARHPDRPVRLLATGEAGAPAFLALALADGEVQRAVIDLDGFDFDRVKSDTDAAVLPGALKYGGIYGFAPLITRTRTTLINVRETGQFDRVKRNANMTIGDSTTDLIGWLTSD